MKEKRHSNTAILLLLLLFTCLGAIIRALVQKTASTVLQAPQVRVSVGGLALHQVETGPFGNAEFQDWVQRLGLEDLSLEEEEEEEEGEEERETCDM